jgi:hypothetical protein
VKVLGITNKCFLSFAGGLARWERIFEYRQQQGRRLKPCQESSPQQTPFACGLIHKSQTSRSAEDPGTFMRSNHGVRIHRIPFWRHTAYISNVARNQLDVLRGKSMADGVSPDPSAANGRGVIDGRARNQTAGLLHLIGRAVNFVFDGCDPVPVRHDTAFIVV